MVIIATKAALTADGDVSFALQFPGGYVQRFEVPREALEDLERSSENTGADLLTFFQNHSDRIIAVAVKKNSLSRNLIIQLKTADF